VASARLEIESIAAGGDGVARSDGLVVFVPRTAPGDIADVEWTAKKGSRFARGRALAFDVESPARVDPPCEHYVRDRCGGCQLQHIRYQSQLAAKSVIVRDAIERIGKREIGLPSVHASAREWRYRRKLTMTMRRSSGRWIAGLHAYDSPDTVFDLRECPITEDAVLATWREIMNASDELPRAAELRGAVSTGDAGAAFLLEGGTRWPRARNLLERVPALAAVWWLAEGKDEAELVANAGDTAGALGASFQQINATVARELASYVRGRVAAHEPRSVVDAYSGTGDLAVELARDGIRVTAIELDRAAAARCGELLPDSSRSITGRVEEELPSVLPADVVVLNPPRKGVDERVTSELEERAAEVRAIVYVSCNPATLARDLSRLPRWRIASLQAFDMFPQTAHVETVCELIPEAT